LADGSRNRLTGCDDSRLGFHPQVLQRRLMKWRYDQSYGKAKNLRLDAKWEKGF
jgi:hypothetical protein